MLKDNWEIPCWLYKALPHIYLVTGVIVTLYFQNNWGLFSGLVWFSVGVLVLGMRFTYRKDHPAKRKPRDTSLPKQTEPGGLELVWSKSYECGNSEIDEQHQQLFRTGNALLAAYHGKLSHKDVGNVLDRLIADLEVHFQSEEELLATWDHPVTEKHKQVHKSLLEKAYEYRRGFQDGNLVLKTILVFFIHDLVYAHIVKHDKKFFHQV